MFLPATENSWLSCRQILKSLVEVYEQGSTYQIDRYVLPEDSTLASMDALARQVSSTDYAALVFPSHRPHPHDFLVRYNLYNQKTPLVFHAYGDFAVDARQWLRLDECFKTRPVRIFAASTRQQKFLQNLVSDPSSVSLLPFLPDTETFKFQEGVGQQLRLERKVADDEWIFFYSGRLSRQKHILELTSVFDRFISQIFPKAQLWLAGEFDDLGIPYIGRSELPFEHYQHWLALKKQSKASDRIHYLGKLAPSELTRYAQAADWGIFASTHNDEDFGLAPLELLLAGTPCFLTDWGGYADFLGPGHTRTIPVDIKNFMLTPDMPRMTKELFVLTSTRKREEASARRARSDHYHGIFSQQKMAQELELGLNFKTNFAGFSENMERLVAAITRNPYAPFVDVASFGGYNKEFEDLYAPYFGRA